MSARSDKRAGNLPRYPDLAGRVAVVTGGSRGIGAATAHALAANGVDVAIVGRAEAALSTVADSIRSAEARAIAVRADCTQGNDVRELADTVAEQLGVVDILAAFAGGNGMPVPTIAETPDHWRQVLDTDLTSTFLTSAPSSAPCSSAVAARSPRCLQFLASDASSRITGTTLTLDIAGGKIMI